MKSNDELNQKGITKHFLHYRGHLRFGFEEKQEQITYLAVI